MKIGIIGAAGVIGSTSAFCIGEKKLADTIAMIDLPGDALDFQVYDLSTAVSGTGIKVVSGGLELLEGVSLVVMAAAAPLKRAASRQEMLSANLSLIEEIAQSIRRYCPDAILVQVTNPIEPMSYAIFHLAGTGREKIIGYTLNDSFRFRIFLGEALKRDASLVEAFVIGEHGSTQVPVFSNVKVDGQPIEVPDDVKEQVFSRIPGIFTKLEYYREKIGRTAAWTSAIGISDVVRAIVTDAKETFPCSTILQGEYGVTDICLGVPAVIGAGGIEHILEFPLSRDEQKAFDHSAKSIRDATSRAMQMLPKQGR